VTTGDIYRHVAATVVGIIVFLNVYPPSAMSWVFSSLHTRVGLAFVGAVVGEYLGSSQGVGYLVLQAEGTFDINTVMAGILVLRVFARVLDAVVGRVKRKLMKWQTRAGGKQRSCRRTTRNKPLSGCEANPARSKCTRAR